MCMSCGNHCAYCGEFSTCYVADRQSGLAVYACDEHVDDADAQVTAFQSKRDAAQWN